MHYFKHSELVDRYGVSLKTVHNWIDAAKRGKLNLKLHDKNGRFYISNTASNLTALEHIAINGKKYRNKLHHKVVQPRPEFYEIFSRRQILDIINNIKTQGEIPRQYNYFGKGARNWDSWLKHIVNDDAPSVLKGTVELMCDNFSAFDRLLGSKKRVNIIDLGVGNALPIKDLLGHLLDRDVLHRYIGIDISESMLGIAENNIKQWYGDRVKFEGYVRDMTHERFDDLLVQDMLDDNSEQTINVVLILGGTPLNLPSFGDVFKTAHASLGSSDLLLFINKIDTEANRRYFDNMMMPGTSKLSPNHQYILDLLNIDESFYEVEMGFDTHLKMRYVRIKLKTTLTIKFKFDEAEQTVNLDKGDTILLLRVRHLTAMEIMSELEKDGFTLLQSSLTKDRHCILTISGVEVRAAPKVALAAGISYPTMRPEINDSK